MIYQNLINEISAGTINPAGVEASMRLQYGTLDHLTRDTFAEEIRLALAMEREEPGCLRKIAESYGMAADYAKWEADA